MEVGRPVRRLLQYLGNRRWWLGPGGSSGGVRGGWIVDIDKAVTGALGVRWVRLNREKTSENRSLEILRTLEVQEGRCQRKYKWKYICWLLGPTNSLLLNSFLWQ